MPAKYFILVFYANKNPDFCDRFEEILILSYQCSKENAKTRNFAIYLYILIWNFVLMLCEMGC